MTKEDIYSPPNAELSDPSYIREITVDLNLASRWARLGAAFLDGALIILFYVAVFHGTEYWDKVFAQNFTVIERLLSILLGSIIYLVFNGYLLSKRGQTIGKWALGIKIVSIESNKIPPLWRVFLIRYAPWLVVSTIPFVGQYLIIVDDLFVFRKDKRCMHDLIAGTKVIKEYAH